MNPTNEIKARLEEMKRIEVEMNTARMQVLDQRRLEDADWYQRVQAHDAEEGVSPPTPRQALERCINVMSDTIANALAEAEAGEERIDLGGERWLRGS